MRIPHLSASPGCSRLATRAHGAFLSGYRAKRVFLTYVRCPRCELLYCPTYYSRGQLEDLYGLQIENMTELPLVARTRTQERYIELLQPELAPEGDYLELGADIGLFARLCADRRQFGHMWCYEPNVGVRPDIDTRLKGIAYSVRTEDFLMTPVADSSVSLAVAVHVLDHIWEPQRTLQELHRSMVRGGRLFVVTHNEGSLLARVLGKRWPPYTLQHPQLYSPSTLRQLAERCGFTVLRLVRTVNYFPVSLLFSAALQVIGLSNTVSPQTTHPQVGIRLGNIGMVAIKSA